MSTATTTEYRCDFCPATVVAKDLPDLKDWARVIIRTWAEQITETIRDACPSCALDLKIRSMRVERQEATTC